MVVSASFLLINFAYSVNLLALALRDVVWLRLLLLPGQLAFLSWGLLEGNLPTIFWNLLFLIINSTQLVRELADRRAIELPEELDDLYELGFSDMRPRDFLMFWEMGDERRICDETIIAEGQTTQALLMIVEGHASVSKAQRDIGGIVRGGFVAEMSFLSGNPASATVAARGEVCMRAWSHEKLRSLQKINPPLYIKVQGAMGRDVSRKMSDAHQTWLNESSEQQSGIRERSADG